MIRRPLPSAIERLPSARVLEFRILGPLEVVGDDGPIPLGGPKQRATLAILLLDANRVVSVERLADDLYAGAAPVTAVTQVQRQISELRKARSTLRRSRPVRRDTSSGSLPISSTFTVSSACRGAAQALARGEAHAGRRSAARGARALARWRRSPISLTSRSREPRSSGSRRSGWRRSSADRRRAGLGRHAQLVGELEELVAGHPLRERFRGQLMLALYRSGRQADALSVYRATRERWSRSSASSPRRTCERSSERS